MSSRLVGFTLHHFKFRSSPLAQLPRPSAVFPVAALQTINRTLGQSLAFVGGAGVERVTVTPTHVELASRVNLLQPRQARVLMNLPLNGLTQAAR